MYHMTMVNNFKRTKASFHYFVHASYIQFQWFHFYMKITEIHLFMGTIAQVVKRIGNFGWQEAINLTYIFNGYPKLGFQENFE